MLDSVEGRRVFVSRRHAARNLRAKVRSLLPREVCTKHEMRNNKVQTIQRRMLAFNQTQQYFVCSQNKTNHMFYSLTPQQIEQINEDKLYFLGDRHLLLYEQFLNDKHPNVRVITASAPCGSRPKHFELEERVREDWDQRHRNKRSELQEEHRMRRHMTAVALKIKHQQAEKHRQMFKEERNSMYRDKNCRQDNKSKNLTANKWIRQQLLGDVTNITEDLRRICLHSRSSTFEEESKEKYRENRIMIK